MHAHQRRDRIPELRVLLRAALEDHRTERIRHLAELPIVRAIVASLIPPDRAQTALTALGITEHLAASASSFGFLTLFGAYMASSTPELPVLIAAGIYLVGTFSAAKAVLIARGANGTEGPASRPVLLM